ncbi:MAG: AI-2E family transporter [Proteobacteria bacterium]|nr:AI-2E family transporter [Pseudomonadota bacterium]RZO99447.1 MAG: AI-2E family transporter [Gammaproteobacteria bacterium]|tara:strand:- start:2038 stop:3093 length:1056 start_codon:yes stop_codon:yes gene_type:complete
MVKFLKNFFDTYFFKEEQYAALVLLLIALVLIYFVGSLITPFFVALLIAYLLNGAMAFFGTRGASKRTALSLAFIIFTAFYVSIFLLLPLITSQIGSLINELPAIANYVEKLAQNLLKAYPELFSQSQVDGLVGSITSFFPSIAEQILIQMNAGFSAMMNALIYIILIPFFVFFFLKDKTEMIEYATYFLPKNSQLLSTLWSDLNVQLFGYIRGKALEMIIVGFITSIVFALIGVNYSILLGIMVGLSVLVPLFGAIIVTIPVVAIGLFQYGLESTFFIFLASYLIIQTLDGNFLFPLLLGREVNLHPVLIILAILIFGGIWGFWGLLLAVPIATFIRAILRVWPKKELTS